MKGHATIRVLKKDDRGKHVVRLFIHTAEGTRSVSYYGDGPEIVARIRADLPDIDVTEMFGSQR